ncbi:MAG: superoxide dismutase family protein [Candidatus Krumholzibacteriia bacterium]
MTTKWRTVVFGAALLIALGSGCNGRDDASVAQEEDRLRNQPQESGLPPAGRDAERDPQAGGPEVEAHADMFRGITTAVAVLQPTRGNDVRGTVRFEETADGVRVTADFQGLEPGSQHGIHVHEFGDVSSPDGSAAGDHYDPDGHEHALPPTTPRHAGDMGNLMADEQGNAHLEETFTNFSVAGLEAPVVGRAVIVHAQPDDGTGTAGNAGPRLAQGVIGITEDEADTR